LILSRRLAALPVILLSSAPALAEDPTFASAFAPGPLGPTSMADPSAPRTATTADAPLSAETPQNQSEAHGREAPVALSADEVSHDKALNIVTARGDVEIEQAGNILYADTVSYNVNQDIVTATGNVSLVMPSGDVVFSDYMQLSGKMKEGAMRDLLMVSSGLARTKARTATRSVGAQGQEINELDHAVYSPCDVCKGKKAPLWQLRATDVVHDSAAQQVTYHNAWLDMFGVPVAYTPYLSHPDPTVKRRSGFLYPSYGNSSTLGAYVRTPYYWVTSENSDVTLTPMLTTDYPSILIGEYRQRLADASFTIDGSGRVGGTVSKSSVVDDTGGIYSVGGNDAQRGHLNVTGEWDINDTWRASTDAHAISSDTYLRRYGLTGPSDYQNNRVTLEGFDGDDYARIETLAFRELRVSTTSERNPMALPRASWTHTGEPGVKGGYWTTQLSSVALMRTKGTDSYRVSGATAWTLPYVAPSGEHYTFTTSLRSDVYQVENYQKVDGTTFTGTTGRIIPEASMRWSWPFSSAGAHTTQVVEPVVVGSVSPLGGNPTNIPNEDSRSLDFDDTIALASNHFTGHDRVETGPRVSYGVNWNTYMTGTPNVFSSFVGQTYRTHKDAVFDEDSSSSGIREGLSDYVGRVRYRYGSAFIANYRVRLNQNNFDVVSHDISVGGGNEALQLTMGYLNERRQVQDDDSDDLEQISFSGTARIDQDWSLAFATNHSLTDDGGPLSFSTSAVYEDECFRFNITGTKDYTSDRDAESGWGVLFTLVFKTIGDTQLSM